ncbi:hypothetical protein FNB79_09795 [Formosa sediminum]|uniref:Uncharacterized protein n=1 Tax=Formosa sediminum TaxID=2594004 RepID=A0A516GRU8_9FLAO|nr:hypothetical protein [Formosa sediminum]QDO94251.1 hypothetical protein FNB79_09795 [Formosa sediminum]
MRLKENIITEKLREKFVSSRISKEIFFVECIEDLHKCVLNNKTYDFIRSSVLLRILLLDKGIETINTNYNIDINFYANNEIITGIALSNRKIREIQTYRDDFSKNKGINYVMLSHEPLKKYNLEEFVEINCLKIKSETEYIFNIRNIINLISNKHGASHLEPNFDLNTMESFFWGKFSPFTMKNDNYFLNKIKEIIIILLHSLEPLHNRIIDNLIEYNSKNKQSSSSSEVTMIETWE